MQLIQIHNILRLMGWLYVVRIIHNAHARVTGKDVRQCKLSIGSLSSALPHSRGVSFCWLYVSLCVVGAGVGKVFFFFFFVYNNLANGKDT